MVVHVNGAQGEAFEGLRMLGEMCQEHLDMLDEREQAMRLMRSGDGDWPAGETLLSALRNVLQAKLAAEGNSELEGKLLDKIAAALGLKDWTPETLGDAVAVAALCSSFPANNFIGVVSTLGPPYEYQEWHYGARGVPWREMGLKDFNDMQVDGWEAVYYASNFVLLRRSVNR